MENELFILSLTLISGILLYFRFKYLPDEQWQFIASFPIIKIENNIWKGINLTYYGLIIACSQVFALLMFIILTGAIGVPLLMVIMISFVLVSLCILASKVFALIVEKKMHTFTVGGASFFGMFIAPFVVFAVYKISGIDGAFHFILPVLACLSIAYSFGEGFGRLACISFGCCYGRPVKSTETTITKFFSRYAFTFYGKTKKISYEAGLDGHRVIPVQAMTSIVFLTTGIFATYLFLTSRYRLSFTITMIITQVWRIASETMRADYRGQGRFSMYQLMALITCLFSLVLSAFLPVGKIKTPNLLKGIKYLWNAEILLTIQILWFLTIVYFGRSKVTGSKITFYVDEEKI